MKKKAANFDMPSVGMDIVVWYAIHMFLNRNDKLNKQ